MSGIRPRTPLFGLAPGGVCRAAACCHPRGALLPHHFTLTDTCVQAVYFLWHFPWVRTLQALPGALPDGARTFLRDSLQNPGDCLADSYFQVPRYSGPGIIRLFCAMSHGLILLAGKRNLCSAERRARLFLWPGQTGTAARTGVDRMAASAVAILRLKRQHASV